jgi:hypothetical protein
MSEPEGIHIPALIGAALTEVISEIASTGSWRDRRKAEWLLGKLEACIAEHDNFARLREPFTPAGFMSGNKRDLRFYLYDRHKP